jgi:hypothetical protein
LSAKSAEEVFNRVQSPHRFRLPFSLLLSFEQAKERREMYHTITVLKNNNIIGTLFTFFLDKKSNKKVKAKANAPLLLPCSRTSYSTTGLISHYI